MKVTRQQLIGVLLISMGTLALEVVLTRIFSVTMWYHFAFLAISMALMGSATAGVLLYFFPALARPDNARKWLGGIAVALSLSVPLTFIIYLQIPFQPVLMNRADWFTNLQFLWLILIYLDLAIPFFLTGLIISLALSAWSQQAGSVYWADLTGAALGCLFSIVALEQLGGINSLLLLGVLLALAALVLTGSWRPRRWVHLFPWLTFLLLVGGLVSNSRAPWIQISVNKAGGEEAPAAYEKWNSQSRVTVYEPEGYPFFWAVGPQRWEETVQAESNYDFRHALLLIDAVAGTPIQSFNGDLDKAAFLRFDLTSLVYHLVKDPTTLVIGPGGGRDVLAALATGAPRVTAVEVNPAIVEAVQGPFADFAGHLYERPDVDVVVTDARGFIDRSSERYDVIQASLIDTWAAGGSGAFALSENSLYTQEAFQAYYDHLSDEGILTVSRWYLPDRPAETLRLVATGMAGWESAGIADPRQHVAVVADTRSRAGTEGLSTTLFKKQPFTAEEVAQLEAAAASLEFAVVYAPGLDSYEEVGAFIAHPDHGAFISEYPLDISPATDNRPFFFNLVLIGDLLDPSLSDSGVYRTSMEAMIVLAAVLGVTLLFATIFILLPLWLGTVRGGLARPSRSLLGYFAALGLAFMLMEIPTIQKFTVYLERPVYSLAVVLFSLLLFSGLGSLWSGRWAEADIERQLRRIFPLLVLLLLLHPFVSIGVLRATIGFTLPMKLVVAVLLLSVLGFLMGIPFPTGVRWAGKRWPGVIPWLWGINGVMSVLGAALATALSIHFGFRVTLLLAAAAYGGAGALLWRLAQEVATNPAQRATPS
jgi:hypothetical protein